MGLDQEIVQGQGMTSLRTRQRLIERLTEKGISDIRVLEAMRDAPRHLFLDEALSTRAYEDLALPIGYQQTISQPYIVAKMTEALIQHDKMSQKPLNSVLEIGTGCGYQSYILSLFSKKVVSLERIKPLQEKAKKTLKGLKVSNIVFNVDDGSAIKESKFDAILSAAAPLEVPLALKEKLSVGGRMIIPVGDNSRQVLTLVTRVSKKEFQETKVEDVLFVPLLKGVVS